MNLTSGTKIAVQTLIRLNVQDLPISHAPNIYKGENLRYDHLCFKRKYSQTR